MLTPVVFADASGTLAVSDHSEVDGRYTHTTLAPASDTTFVDLTTQPRVEARLFDRRTEFRLVYAPRLSLTFAATDWTSSFFVMNTGNADVAWHDRLFRSDLTEDWQLGQTNQPAAAAPPAQALPGQATPAPTVQQNAVPQATWLVVSRTAETVTLRPDHLTSLSMTVAYLLNGGLDTSSQQIIPLQKGPRADVSLGYKARRDVELVTSAFAQRSEFTEENPCVVDPITGGTNTTNATCAPQADVVQAAEEIRYALDPATALSAGLGSTVTRTRPDPEGPYHDAWFPNASVSATYIYGPRGRLALQAQLAPVIDFRSGTVSNRLQGTASVAAPAGRSVTVHASVLGAQTVPTDDPLALTLLSGNVDAEIVVDQHAAVQVGARGQWQEQATFGSFFFTYVYFGVTASAPALRF